MNNAHASILEVALAAAPAAGMDDDLARAVFEGFPHGLLVIDADRRVVAANDEARRLLGRAELGGHAEQELCCALLGCRGEGSALQELCLTERALADGRALPDVRIDLVTGDESHAIWVGAAPLGHDQVIMQLRPGRAGDRRRRTEPHWTAGPALRMITLGRTQVIAPEGPLDGAWLRQRPGQLLKLLVSNRHRVTYTDEIAVTFWPDNERTAMQNVRYFVHGLRGQLEPGRPARSRSSFIVAHDGGYGLDLGRIGIDADEFEEQAQLGLRAMGRADFDTAQIAFERAAALYGGDFLADEPYAEWAFSERALLHELACRTFGGLADLALAAGAAETAIGHLHRLARMEPLDSEIQQRLLRLLLDLGRSGEALRHYRHAQAAWTTAFGEKPDFDLASLRRASQQTRAAA